LSFRVLGATGILSLFFPNFSLSTTDYIIWVLAQFWMDVSVPRSHAQEYAPWFLVWILIGKVLLDFKSRHLMLFLTQLP
jgi:hypothetical protein